MQLAVAAKPIVAVFGATGHTGRFVVAELLRRDVIPIAIARDATALGARSFFECLAIPRRHATIDDAGSLDHALRGAQVLINCAGPFIDTAESLVAAALRAGIHYIDLSAEQASTQNVLEKFDAPARQAGIAVVPSMAFFGGLADLMVAAAREDWDEADSIEVLIGLDHWHPTRGTRNTLQRTNTPPMVVRGGQLAPATTPAARKRWDFGGPLGMQALLEVPLTESVLISRHMPTGTLQNYVSHRAFREALNPSTPGPIAQDEVGRARQPFAVETIITRGAECRRSIVRGMDLYAVSAALACEAAERLIEGTFTTAGASAPGEIFQAEDFLQSARRSALPERADPMPQNERVTS